MQRQELAPQSVAGCEFAGQARHALAPAAAEYVPAPQLLQVVASVAPTVAEYVPAAQSEQASKDTVALYLPAAHETQLCASGPVEPAGHPAALQSSSASLPAGELVPAGHSAQDTILELMQVITVLYQTVSVFKEVVQPDRHPPMTPPKFQDNRFSQSVDSMSDGFKLILLDGANPTELLVEYQKALLLGYATVVEEDVKNFNPSIAATSENFVADELVREPITVQVLRITLVAMVL